MDDKIKYFVDKYQKGSKFTLHPNNPYADTALSFVPFYGTAMDVEDFVKDPSLKNASHVLLSLLGDISGGFAVKGLIRAAKLNKWANRAIKYNKSLGNSNSAFRISNKDITNALKESQNLIRKSQGLFAVDLVDSAVNLSDSYETNFTKPKHQKDSKFSKPNLDYNLWNYEKQDLINLVNNSSAEFVNRLKQYQGSIPNWENPEEYSTLKLSYANDDNGYFIYPDVQNINGKLVDFSNPDINKGNKWLSLDSAFERKDYIRFPNELSASWFTENYKKYFPNVFKPSK